MRLFNHPTPKNENLQKVERGVIKEPEFTYPQQACILVAGHILETQEKTDPVIELEADDVYVVWFTYTLGNWKALVSTTLPDGKYYEVTHDAGKKVTYIDTYVKVNNVAIPDDARGF